MNTIILAGWGYPDCACAAAAAMRKFKNQSEAMGASRRRLPEILSGLAAEKSPRFGQALLMGMGLTGNPDKLLKSLRALRKKRVEVRWFSVLPWPEWLSDTLRGEFAEVVVKPEAGSLTELVAGHYGVECADLLPVVSDKCRTDKKGTPAWNLLLDAARFQYRNYQDQDAFGMAVRALAGKWKTLPERQTRMIEHYEQYGDRELKGKSPAMIRLWGVISAIGPTSARVLIHGESGTGKETVACQLHFKSSRKDNPFIPFNCAAMNLQLLESRLFGYRKGAFTGASADSEGAIAAADGGTLFLDEVGELPPEAQAGLLRVLQDGRFSRLGEAVERQVDVRVIAATNRDLPAMVRNGAFREDLFYRLNVIPILVPPLRERPEDIPEIANHFWRQWRREPLSVDKLNALDSHHWPGNIRELRNFLERMSALKQNDFAAGIAEHQRFMAPASNGTDHWPDKRDDLLRLHAARMLAKHGNIQQAAKAAGIARNTFKNYLPPPE